MRGRRLWCNDAGEFFTDHAMSQKVPGYAWQPQEGDYWQYDGDWYAKAPNGLRCGLRGHAVVENADHTITVSPSILVTGCDGVDKTWHGFLVDGVWREA